MDVWELKCVKKLQGLNYKKNDQIVKVAKIELKLKILRISREIIDYFKKSIIPKKYLHLVFQAKKKSVSNIIKNRNMFIC